MRVFSSIPFATAASVLRSEPGSFSPPIPGNIAVIARIQQRADADVNALARDEELRKSIQRQLRAAQHAGLKDVAVSVHDGQVRLSGAVPSYHLKQLAQSLVLPLAGRVDNDLTVKPPVP